MFITIQLLEISLVGDYPSTVSPLLSHSIKDIKGVKRTGFKILPKYKGQLL